MAGHGIEATFKMLRSMSTERWLSASDIARASGTPLVTTYNRLKSLERMGIVERSNKRFQDITHQDKTVNLYRRTIIFMGERRKV